MWWEQDKNIKNPLRSMQDVSYEPLMLCPSGNPSSKFGYFQTVAPSPHMGLCIHRKAINIDKPLVFRRTALNIVGFAFVFSPRHSLSKLSSAHLA